MGASEQHTGDHFDVRDERDGNAHASGDGDSLLAGYSPHEHRPLRSYAALTGVFGVGLGGALLALRASGRELPERLSFADVVLVGVASHKLSRMTTKDKATSFLRAPFTSFQGTPVTRRSPRSRAATVPAARSANC